MSVTVDATIEDQLKALLRLQYVDSRIDQIKKLQGDLPEEIGDLEYELHGLRARIDKVEEERKAKEQERSQAKVDRQDAEQLIKRYEEQQLQVRNNREYDALTKEIEAQRQRIMDSDLRLQDAPVEDAIFTQQIEETQVRITEVENMLSEKRTELASVMNDTRSEQEILDKHRAEQATGVSERYLRAYERLRGRVRDGRAVVPLERGAASGYAVPPQRQSEIRQRNRIIPCEHTGRIVVDFELYSEVLAEMEQSISV